MAAGVGGRHGRKRYDTDVDAVDRIASVFVEGLSETYALGFEEQDYSKVRSAEAFEQAMARFGASRFDVH